MKAYCTQSFIAEFRKLSKKKQYNTLEILITEFFLENDFVAVATGNVLYGPRFLPFLKKRLPDSGGFRIYFLADFESKSVYINFVHPKKGPDGCDNISASKKKELHDCILNDRKDPTSLFQLRECPDTGELLFEEVEEILINQKMPINTPEFLSPDN